MGAVQISSLNDSTVSRSSLLSTTASQLLVRTAKKKAERKDTDSNRLAKKVNTYLVVSLLRKFGK